MKRFHKHTPAQRSQPRPPSNQAGRARPAQAWFVAAAGRAGMLALSMLSAILAIGCSPKLDRASLEAAWCEVGGCDQPVVRHRFTILCDSTLLAPCDLVSLTKTLDVVLGAASAVGGNPVEVWMLGGSVADTRSLGEQISPVLPEGRERSRGQAREQWIRQAKTAFLKAAEPALEVHPRRSALAEALTKIALAHPQDKTLPTELVIVSDAREVSLVGDFECDPPPAPEAWAKRLARRGILPPDSLGSTRIYWTFVNVGSMGPRCRQSVAQEQLVRATWRGVLAAAGATRVEFLSGPVVLAGDGPAALARKE